MDSKEPVDPLEAPFICIGPQSYFHRQKKRVLGISQQLAEDPLFVVREIPDGEYSWWAHTKALFQEVEKTVESGHHYFLSALPYDTAIFRSPSVDELNRLIGGAACVFRSPLVKDEMSPVVEGELFALDRPLGLDFAVVVGRSCDFMRLLDSVVVLKNRDPSHEGGEYAYPGGVRYPDYYGGTGESDFEFSARAAFQSLMAIHPDKIKTDQTHKFFCHSLPEPVN